MTEQRILGILAATKSKSFRYGELDQLCREFIALGEMFGWSVYIFSPEDIRRDRRINAWRFDELGKRWYCESSPEPCIVYDRLLVTKKSHQKINPWLHAAARRGVLFLNATVENKHKVYRVLSTSALLREHLPYSEIAHSKEGVERWLRRRGCAYVKPIRGTQGRGVHRVATISDIRLKLDDFQKQRFLIQDEIPVQLHQGRRPDLRCFMQKDYFGVWQLTFCGVRLGSRGSDVSNLHQGGEGLSSETYLRFLPLGKRKHLYERLLTLNKRICTLLERRYGFLCELGIDWGIDSNGKPWLIEVNSKPGRRLMCLLGAEAERLLSLRRIFECAELRLSMVRRRGIKDA